MIAPLVAEHLSRCFGDYPAVDDVSLRVSEGQIHAIVGLNGAGKTTLMRLLLGMLRPDSGRAMVYGQDGQKARAVEFHRIGHLIETPFAYRELTVRENLAASALLNGLPRREVGTAVDRAIAEFELGEWAERKAAHISLGNRQRLGLASAFLHHPSALVLDEPANALDPAGVVFTRRLLQQYAGSGAAVLVSSHHFDQLARVADEITVLHRGKIVGSLDPAEPDLEQAFFDLVHDWDLERGVRT